MKSNIKTSSRSNESRPETGQTILNTGGFFQAAFENAGDAVFFLLGDTIIECNRRTWELFDCCYAEILQKKLSELSPLRQPDGSDSPEKLAEYIQSAREGRPQFFTWQLQKTGGALFEAEISLNRLRVAGQTVVQSLVRDLSRVEPQTEQNPLYSGLTAADTPPAPQTDSPRGGVEPPLARHQADREALLKSEAKYRAFVDQVKSIVLEMDCDGIITFMNRYGREFFGYRSSEIVGKSVLGTIVPETDHSGFDLRRHIQNILRDPEKYFSSENENMRKNGQRVWVAWTNRVIFNPEPGRSEILCIGIDRTEQKRAQEQMAEEMQEKAAFKERNRLARDLHDAVSQTLFSASLIAEVLPQLWERNPVEARKRLEEVRQLSRGALAEMRTLLFELRPAALAEAELGDLVKHLADSVTGRGRIPVSVETAGRISLHPEVKVAFYRIAQEALNNVAKHSGASEARVRLDSRPDCIVLRVSDNGHGFDKSSLRPESLGLGIMQERAEAVGAELEIDSEPGCGTVVSVRWSGDTARVA